MPTKAKTDRVRTPRGPFLVGLFVLVATALPSLTAAQTSHAWRFDADPFVELWFHGVALVGLEGTGRVSLYREGYAAEVMRARRDAGTEPSALERARASLAVRFAADPAFEVLHFVPLYFADVPVPSALDALDPRTTRRPAGLDARAVRGAEALRHMLETPSQREALALFVDALRSERPPAAGAGRTAERVAAEAARIWETEVEPALRDFLEREGFSSGRALLVPALDREGRYVDGEGRPLVAVGASADDDPRTIVASVVRELCYPAVRRAVSPYESRFQDRRTASDVSDMAATRCGALLLSERAPALVEAYRGRYGDVSSRAAFLSAAGLPPSVASLEGVLDDALRRELNLNEGSDRADARSSGR